MSGAVTGDFTADNAAGAVFAEFDKFQNFRDLGKFGFDQFQSLAGSKFTTEIYAVEMFDDRDGFAVHAGALKSDFVDHLDAAVAAFRHHKGRHVFGVGGQAGNNGKSADPAELMDRHQTGENGVVVNFSITSGDGAVDIDHMIADFAVVSDMAGRHKEAVITDDGLGSGLGSAVNGGAFAENVAVTDFDIGSGAGFDGMILGGLTDGGEGMKHVVFTDGGVTVNIALGQISKLVCWNGLQRVSQQKKAQMF